MHGVDAVDHGQDPGLRLLDRSIQLLMHHGKEG